MEDTAIARFFDAIREGDQETLTALLNERPTLVTATEDGNPPLFIAAMYGFSGRTQRYKGIVEFLIDRGAIQDVFASAYLDNPALTQTLLREDASRVGARDVKGNTALHYAAERGATQVAELLIQHGADVNAPDSRGQSPLHNAAHPGPWKESEASQIIALLKGKGATMAIWLAASLGDTEAIGQCLDADPALINATDQGGETALFHAAHNLRRDAVRLLLARGADVNKGNPLATVRLHSWDEGGLETVQILLDAGAEPDFIECCSRGLAGRVREALERDVTLLHQNERVWAPIHAAVRSNRCEVLELLIQHGADVNVKYLDGETPLASALRLNHQEIAELLRKHGASV